MAIKEIKREWSPCQLGYVKEFLLHTEEDLKNMPRCSVGSKAIVSETDNEYVKTGDGWMLLCDCDEDGGTGGGGGVQSVNGVTPDENGNVETNRSNPIPFNKSGNTVKCVIPFVQAKEIINKGMNQATVTLSITSPDMSTMTIVTETKHACRVTDGIDLSTGEMRWIQADFAMDDGTIARYQLNPDETVTETIIKPDSSAGGSGEKSWLIYSPEDDDVNFVLAEIDTAWTDNPVTIGWDVLKVMNPNEIMCRLVSEYGSAACTGVNIRTGENGVEGIVVCFRSYMGVFTSESAFKVQDSYYNITSSGIEFYGRTPLENLTLNGGTLTATEVTT